MDLIVINGRVVAMDADGTAAEAVAIRDGRVAVVGANDEALALKQRGTRVVDAGGKAVLPGFIEPHNHLMSFATSLLGVDVKTPPNRNIREMVLRLRQRADTTPADQWVIGRGYDDTGLEDMRHPTREDLDQASVDHPIVIWHISGHLLVANTRALDIAGIGAETPDPPGGRIGRVPGTGEPDGVLYEAPAEYRVTRAIPPYDEADTRRGFLRAQEEYLRKGITTIHDAGVARVRGLDILQVYRQAHEDDVLKLRVNMFLRWEFLKELEFSLVGGSGDEWLRVAGCKIIADGSIQGVTAALREPYYCQEDESGWLIYEQEELNEMVLEVHRRGYQIAIHANGDAAIDAVLEAYGSALKAIPKSDHRFRIEHCQVCRPEHIREMKRLGVIPDLFANHVYYWGDRHRERFLGPERVGFLDPVGSAIRAGMRPLLHSDCPVTPVSPLFCMQSAVSRLTSSGETLSEHERVTVHEAMSTMTVNAARGAFEEESKGTLEVGKLGDLVVLSQDPFREPAHEIGRIEVAATVVGGRLMYAADSLSVA